MFQRILAAVDEAPAITPRVLAESIAIAKATGAELLIAHVLVPFRGGYPDSLYTTLDGTVSTINPEAFGAFLQEWNLSKQRNLQQLQNQVSEAEAAGVRAQSKQIIGEPNRAICDLAKDWSADLIVMGRRGHSGLTEILMGSVSSYVMHHAPCSVLTVQGHDVEAVPASGQS